MKRALLYISLACAAVLSGCEKDLDQTPISNGSVPDFYKTAADFDQAMSSVYSTLRGYPDREVILSELRSDNMFAVSSIGSRDWDPVNNFSAALLVINPYVADAWASDYSTIFRANTMLDQLAQNGAVTGSLRTRYEGEAKFIRAFMYLDLVRKFGKVPVIDKPLIPQDVAKIPRSEVSAVYDLIEADLKTAIGVLPPAYTGSGIGPTLGLGRVTNGAAKGLLALMYLTKSGPTYGISGPGMASNEYDKANVLLDELINNNGTPRSAVYSLQSTYANIFSPTAENNSEVLFDLQYIANGTLGSSFPNVVAPDTYYTFLGLTFTAGSVEIKPCSNDLNNVSYATTDTRRAVNIQQSYTYTSGTTVINETRPFYKKYINIAAKGASRTDWAINYIVLRYADILMMKAECEVRGVGGSAASAAARLTPLRTRAGLPALTTLTLETLMEERRREFAGENLRWNDLMRSGLALTTMNAWADREDPTRTATGQQRDYKIVRPLTENLLLYPVPQVELSSAPGLYIQNPGYN